MSRMSQLDESLQVAQGGIIVEDITALVRSYYIRLAPNPITLEKYSEEQVASILVNNSALDWSAETNGWVLYMETLLLKDLISTIRLNQIQYELAIKDLKSVLDNQNTDLACMYESDEEIIDHMQLIINGIKACN